MKQKTLLKHLKNNGCVLKREGRSHSIWQNSLTGDMQTIPRHSEISNILAKKICKYLNITQI